MASVTFKFEVNGSDENPYAIYGLKNNPFPSVGRYEYDRADHALQSLGGIPIKSPDDIRQRLKGALPDEVIERVITKHYQPGKIVKVELTLHWE